MTTKRIVISAPWGVEVERPNPYARLVTQRRWRGKIEKFDRPTPIGINREPGAPEINFDDPAIVWAETEEEFVARTWARIKASAKLPNSEGRPIRPHITDDTEYAVVDVSEIPTDRTHRNQWRLKAGKIHAPSGQ